MRDFVVSLFDFDNSDNAGIFKIILAAIVAYILVCFAARLALMYYSKTHHRSREAEKNYKSLCTFLYFGNSVRKRVYLKNVPPIILTVVSAALYYCSINYNSIGIPDSISEWLFIAALACNAVVFLYYAVWFISDVGRNDGAFTLAASIPYRAKLKPDGAEEDAPYPKWNFDAAFVETGKPSINGGDENSSNAAVKVGLILLQIITFLGNVVIYGIGRMLNVFKTLIVSLILHNREKAHYFAKASKYAKKKIMRGVLEVECGIKSCDANHPANLLLSGIIAETLEQSFDGFCKGNVPDLVVVNYFFDAQTPKSVLAFSNAEQYYIEESVDTTFTRRLYADKAGNLYRIEINSKGDFSNISDYKGMNMELKRHKNQLSQYVLQSPKLSSKKQVIIYKWMMYHALEYYFDMHSKREIRPIILFFSNHEDGVTSYTYKTVYVPIKDIEFDDSHQSISLPTIPESEDAV